MAGPMAFIAMLVGVTIVSGNAMAVTPVQKVLQMMDEIKVKAIEEKQAEEVTFTKFSNWCKNTDKNKVAAIERADAQIEKLKADIQKYDSDAVTLGQEIRDLDTLSDTALKERTKATQIRKVEKEDYVQTHNEYVDNIAQMELAIEKVKSMMSNDGASAASFIQEWSTKMPSKVKSVLMAFLATSATTELATDAPEAAAFKSQSGGILDMVTELHEKMEDEDATLTQEETAADQAFQMLAQQLTDQIEKHTASRNRKASTKKKKESDAGEARGELAETQSSRDSDAGYLSDLRATCEQKHKDFAARQQMRAEELVALDKAIEIIGGDAVSGSADKHLPSLLQTQAHSALAQLRTNTQQPTQTAAASFLKLEGQRINSNVLAAISLRVSSDPFNKVKKMIKDMVVKLMEEANEEAEHKGFCDTELATNKQQRDAKTTEVGELTASIEELTAKSQKLSTEITELTEQVAQLDAAIAKATGDRQEEKEKNTATIADAQAAIAAVSQATTVLKEFYAKAAGATAFAQFQARGVDDDMPETFDKPFTGTGGEGGIVGMLEVILSDFERLEAETTQAEAASTQEFEQFMNDSKMDKAVKGQDIKNKEGLRQKTDSSCDETKMDLKSAQEELDAAMEYFEKLKPSCVDAGISYEDRVARRKEEIQSLEEALKILTP